MIPYKASIQWSVSCARCGVEVNLNTFRVITGDTMPMPTLADGWRVLDGLVLCPRHVVTITDKKARTR